MATAHSTEQALKLLMPRIEAASPSQAALAEYAGLTLDPDCPRVVFAAMLRDEFSDVLNDRGFVTRGVTARQLDFLSELSDGEFNSDVATANLADAWIKHWMAKNCFNLVKRLDLSRGDKFAFAGEPEARTLASIGDTGIIYFKSNTQWTCRKSSKVSRDSKGTVVVSL